MTELTPEQQATVQRFDDADVLDALEADMAQIGAVMALGPLRAPVRVLADMIEKTGAQRVVQPHEYSEEMFEREVA